ncbi:MAG: DNA mismatch repair protein MutS [Fidelibacterota bacterium]
MTRSRSEQVPSRGRQGMTPLMRQYTRIKRDYSDALVLFRMGDFYETFDDDARTASRILGITLTKRSNGAARDVPLAGFPHRALDVYLPKLTGSGLRVAICEQVEDPKVARGVVKREVVEVVTPGTAYSDDTSTGKTNNFLGAITYGQQRVGFAFLDHSTGEFYAGESEPEEVLDNLLSFRPREMIVQEDFRYDGVPWYDRIRPFITEMDVWAFDYDTSRKALLDHFETPSLQGYGCEDFVEGVQAAGVILRYVEQNVQGQLNHVTKLIPIRNDDILGLDDFTVRNLELFSSLSTQGTHGSLMSILDDTVTAGGGRLLRRWLNRPLTRRAAIEARFDRVEGLVANPHLRGEVRRWLRACSDLERVVGKLSRGRAAPRDVAGLKATLEIIPALRQELSGSGSDALRKESEDFQDTVDLVAAIGKTLVDSPPVSVSQGGVIRQGVDEELDELRDVKKRGKEWIASLESDERRKTGIPSLKVGYNRVFGYYLEVTKVHQKRVPETYIRKQTLVNAERYATPELKEFEEKILTAEEKIEDIETRLFLELRSQILSEAHRIQHNGAILNRLDVYASLAEVASDRKYVRPVLNEDRILRLSDARHPVVETLLPSGEKFVANDLDLSAEKDQILLITGPNMAGKSTFLRQVGLIVVLAQMGSFVPAREATIGIVDRLFTRVGASDNLAGGESTFLVEMTEAANILNNATPRSLVLFDEIGRGTATYDGLSLAWAITEYLHDSPGSQARTLFATHYHELTGLEELMERVRNVNAAVKESGEKIVFLRKIVPGPCDKSYGIHVAQMAGVPQSVITRAQKILNHLVGGKPGAPHRRLEREPGDHQIGLFEQKESEFRKALDRLDIDQMTPLEALQKLHELKSRYGK